MRRVVPIVLGAAVLAALFFALRPGDEDPTPEPIPSVTVTTAATGTPASTPPTEPSPGPGDVREVEVSYENGQATGPQRVAVERGTRVRITVTSDVPEQVHVHTYDLVRDVGPGAPAVLDFVADVSGVFEVELEGSHVLLFRLEVGA